MSEIIEVHLLAGTSVSSRLIELSGIGAGGYSHAASLLKDGRYLDARSDRIAGVLPGVQLRDPKTETWMRRRRATLEVDETVYAEWEASLRAKLTDGYGFRDIIDFLDGSSAHVNGRWICSALAVNAVQHISRRFWKPGTLGYVPYPLWIKAHQVSPNTCLTILEVAGFTIHPEETLESLKTAA